MESDSVLAFDIEIRELPAEHLSWRDCRPLDVTCVGLAYFHGGVRSQGSAWSHRFNAGGLAESMSKEELSQVVMALAGWANCGGTLVSFNGLSFDLPVLAEITETKDILRDIALGPHHVDLMFNVFMALGYNIGLNTYSTETLGIGKMQGISGAKAPVVWQSGDHERVLKYVEQDAAVTRDLYLRLVESRVSRWRTQRGQGQMRILSATVDWSPEWSVERMLKKSPPEPAYWMTRPPTLKSFLEDWQ